MPDAKPKLNSVRISRLSAPLEGFNPLRIVRFPCARDLRRIFGRVESIPAGPLLFRRPHKRPQRRQRARRNEPWSAGVGGILIIGSEESGVPQACFMPFIPLGRANAPWATTGDWCWLRFADTGVGAGLENRAGKSVYQRYQNTDKCPQQSNGKPIAQSVIF